MRRGRRINIGFRIGVFFFFHYEQCETEIGLDLYFLCLLLFGFWLLAFFFFTASILVIFFFFPFVIVKVGRWFENLHTEKKRRRKKRKGKEREGKERNQIV